MAFTRDWDSDLSSDTTDAIQIDDYINKALTDIEERMKTWCYGFVSGENDGVGGLISAKLKVQASVTQIANTIHLYGKDVSDKCELHAIDEEANEIQMTAAGNIGGANLELLAGKDLLGSATSDITINTDKFTVAGATGNTAIAGTLGVTGVATLGDTSALASDAAPAEDAEISNKKYVDDQIAAIQDPAYSGGESHTFDGGLIIKSGYTARSGNSTTVTFGTAFPTGIISFQATVKHTASNVYAPNITSLSTTAAVIYHDASATGYYWTAIGH